MQDIVIGWSEVLAIIGSISVMVGAMASYHKVTILRAVDRMLDEKLEQYMPTRELDLRLHNLELKLGTKNDPTRPS